MIIESEEIKTLLPHRNPFLFLDKVEILKQQSEFIKKVLEYTYNPYKQYNVTSKTCKKNSGLFKYNTYKDVFELLDDLTSRKITITYMFMIQNRC